MNTTVPESSPAATSAESAPASTRAALPSAASGPAPEPARWLEGLVVVALVAMVLLRLSSYGIWDPWELSVADAARKLGEGAGGDRSTSLTLRMVQASFAIFGTREWAGRLPIALSGLALLLVTGLWVKRFAGARAALYSLLVLGTTPLFLLHSREMVGATPAFLASALVAIGASNAIFEPAAPTPKALSPWLWLALSGLASALGIFTAGALLTVVPPLLAVSAATLLLGIPFNRAGDATRRSASLVVLGGTLVVGSLVLRAVMHHGSEYSVWTGGAPLDEAVPTFERVITQLFHGLAPWSAAAPVAVGALLWTDSAARADAPLRLICLLWATLAFAATTVFISAFGSAAFTAPAAITIAIALWLSQLEDRRDSFWPEFVITLLMLGLLIRDYALYPSSPFDALALLSASAPEKFNPKAWWAIVFGAFGFALLLSCMATRERAPLDLGAPYHGARALWSRSPGHRAWLVLGALLWLGLVIFGVLCVAAPPGVRLTSIARRVGTIIGVVVLLAPLGVAAVQVLFQVSRELANVRNLPLVIAALVCGVYASQVFLPKLSAHLSPREVFDVFERLAGDKEPLAQHQVHGRAAAYYVHRDVKDIENEAELVTYLAAPDRRWALLPSERLPDVDVAFRRRTGKHLFVPNAENARVSLVANQPVEKQVDENPLSKFVLKSAPKPQFPVGANFEGKIELVGYDLELPQKDYVGPGQTFTVTWIFRVLQGNLGTYQTFLHVDAEGQRINGDHDPVDGMYPVRLWDLGDVVVDRQKVSVPATTPPGTYTLYTGFFRGETRLKVLSGPRDDVDRVLAGKIQVR
ncbi:MAG: Polymyxin resistance protein ArnT, undecaprenyl phosphate-alpha-L-Ara4N transferase [Myxococcaceae bacterium]|nr:Polymyxin resistance protein ArnT, undecaprenyl phosphate-alpha-L-Ara4N transferase [Myxococcaceae bacterium]